MRLFIGLLAIVIGLSVCTSAGAQDPASYDPNYYDYYDVTNPANPYSSYARRQRYLRAQKLKVQPGVLAKMQAFTSNVATGVSSGVFTVVNTLAAANDPNNSIPKISTGPSSPLTQAGSPTGSVADAQSPRPPGQSMFGPPSSSNFNLFGKPYGPATASGSVLGKQP